MWFWPICSEFQVPSVCRVPGPKRNLGMPGGDRGGSSRDCGPWRRRFRESLIIWKQIKDRRSFYQTNFLWTWDYYRGSTISNPGVPRNNGFSGKQETFERINYTRVSARGIFFSPQEMGRICLHISDSDLGFSNIRRCCDKGNTQSNIFKVPKAQNFLEELDNQEMT